MDVENDDVKNVDFFMYSYQHKLKHFGHEYTTLRELDGIFVLSKSF